MKYAILIYGDEQAEAKATEAKIGAVIARYNAYGEALAQSGTMVSGERLRPSSEATRVRVRSGKRTLTDGPFTETKEVLGGFYIIECKSREEANDWGAKCPGAEDAYVEVWPVWE